MRRDLSTLLLIGAALTIPLHVAADDELSAAEMAEKLANPTQAVGQLGSNFDFTEYEGTLPGADDQRGWSYLFQPSLPFPQKNGRNLILRPAFPVLFKQPVFDATSGQFDDEFDLGDVAYDIAYAGMSKSGLITSVGAVGSIPTATDDAVGRDQWTLGPAGLIGVARKWGILGLLVNHQWDIMGDENVDTNITGGQYFYGFPFGDRTWYITAGPTWSYNHELTGEKWTLPVGIGLSKTTRIGDKTWKFQFQYWNFVKTPDAFGPEEQIRFTITPVIKLPWG